jgi:hypothetical protein
MTQLENLTAFLHNHVVLPDVSTPWVTLDVGGTRRTYYNAESLGQALAADATFQALRLGGWLNTPDGEFISKAVGAFMPWPYHPAYKLLVDGLREAARLQQQGKRQAAANTATVTLLVGAVMLICLQGFGGD